jgi:hypothetical protein
VKKGYANAKYITSVKILFLKGLLRKIPKPKGLKYREKKFLCGRKDSNMFACLEQIWYNDLIRRKNYVE